MAVLAKRLKELKQKSVEKTLQTSLNWRQGQCSHIVRNPVLMPSPAGCCSQKPDRRPPDSLPTHAAPHLLLSQVVARIDDWVRKIKFHGDLLCLGTHGCALAGKAAGGQTQITTRIASLPL